MSENLCTYCGRPLGDEKQLEDADFENTVPDLCFSDVLFDGDNDPHCMRIHLQTKNATLDQQVKDLDRMCATVHVEPLLDAVREAGLKEKETEGPTGGGGIDHAHTIRLLGRKAKQAQECSGTAECECFHCNEVRRHERKRISARKRAAPTSEEVAKALEEAASKLLWAACTCVDNEQVNRNHRGCSGKRYAEPFYKMAGRVRARGVKD